MGTFNGARTTGWQRSGGMKNEGKTTSVVEMQTRKIPSITFLGMAIGAMAASAALLLMGKKQVANFIGQWVPSILIMGTYNKIAKTFTAPVDEEERRRHGDNASPMKSNLGTESRTSPVM
jgi:hypothetical protein